MILIHPPVVKPSEPPAGLAALSGALGAYGLSHTLLDANLEAVLWLLQGASSRPTDDTWTRRALLHLPANLAFLRDWQGYATTARYRKAVSEVNRVLEKSAPQGAHVSLADYGHDRLIPVKSGDLLHAAGHPEENAFYPYFSARIEALLEDGETHSVIGFSLNYLSQALCAFSMIGFLRLRYPHLRIVLGGGLVTSWMSNAAWNNPFEGLVDHLVSGPGEPYLLALSGVEARIGTTYLPSFDGLPLSLYLAPGPILPYAGSRGCYWRRCSFCPEKTERQTYSPKPAERGNRRLKGACRHIPPRPHPSRGRRRKPGPHGRHSRIPHGYPLVRLCPDHRRSRRSGVLPALAGVRVRHAQARPRIGRPAPARRPRERHRPRDRGPGPRSVNGAQGSARTSTCSSAPRRKTWPRRERRSRSWPPTAPPSRSSTSPSLTCPSTARKQTASTSAPSMRETCLSTRTLRTPTAGAGGRSGRSLPGSSRDIRPSGPSCCVSLRSLRRTMRRCSTWPVQGCIDHSSGRMGDAP